MKLTLTSALLIIGSTSAGPETRTRTGLRQKPITVTSLSSVTSRSTSLEFDQQVAHQQAELLFGEDNLNGGFTVSRENNIEIGLRTKMRYPIVENEYNSNGDGSYRWPKTDCIGETSNCKVPHWSLEFSVATLGANTHIRDYCWQLGMDADPSPKTDFTTFDPISQSHEAAFFDHSFGDLDSDETKGNSIYKLVGTDCTASIESAQFCQRYYTELLANYNVAQNYWSYGFSSLPGTSLYYFDRGVDGNYVVYLRALDCKTQEVLSSSYIQVLVGDAPKLPAVALPEPIQVSHGPRTIDCPLHSNLEFSQDLNLIIMNNEHSNSLTNGGFTTDRRNGIEIALRTRQNGLRVTHELPASNAFHEEGDGIFWWQRAPCSDNIVSCTSSSPQWNLELSIATSNQQTISSYCWEMGIDVDPSDATEFVKFDPMTPSDVFPFFSHSFASANDVTIKSIEDGTCSDPQGCQEYYNSLLKSSNLAQTSWNLGEMFGKLVDLDYSKDGNYAIYLRAKECGNAFTTPTILAESFIQVLVGSKYPVWNVQLPPPQRSKPTLVPASAVI